MTLRASAEHTTPARDLAQMRLHLAQALGPRVGVALTQTAAGDPEDLWPIERAGIRSAVAKRQAEYAAGRTAAREALASIGHPPVAIPSATDRSPIWPPGVVGSLAHTHDVCVAVVAWRHQASALGIDIEPDQAMDEALWTHICAPDELAALHTLPPTLRGHRATRLFCAKEAFYKWQYPQTGRLLEFHEVQIDIDADNSRFRVQLDARVARQITTSAIPEGKLLGLNRAVIAFIGL